MPHSPAPGTPQTALKAHVAGIATAIAALAIQWLNARYGLAIEPAGPLVEHGVQLGLELGPALVNSVVAGGIAWVSAYLPSNKAKA